MTKEDLIVANNVVVSLGYMLQLEDGELVDQSAEGQPLVYLHGNGQLIPGLENALYGLAVGDEKQVEVLPSEGYGERDEGNFQLVPHSAFPDNLKLEEGMPLQMRDSQSGQVFGATVADINEAGVLLDFNHPLAGEKLYFSVKVKGLRQATDEEIAHQHVH